MDMLVALETAPLLPVYVSQEEDFFFTQQALATLKKRILTKGLEAFNYSDLDASALDVADVLNHCCTMPMMAKQRLVFIRGLERIKPAYLSELASYLKKPQPSCVVLMHSSKKIDGRSEFARAIKQAGADLAFTKMNAPQAKSYLMQLAKAEGKAIDGDAIFYLLEVIGIDPPRLAIEIKKAATFVGEKPAISLVDVEEVVAEVKISSIFDLFKSIDNKDMAGAMKILGNLLENATPHLMILSMLGKHVREKLEARVLAKQGKSEDEIAQALGLRPFLVRDFFRVQRSMSPGRVLKNYKQLIELDLAFKTSSVDQDLMLTQLVYELAR